MRLLRSTGQQRATASQVLKRVANSGGLNCLAGRDLPLNFSGWRSAVFGEAGAKREPLRLILDLLEHLVNVGKQ
jgi:hypothetical protein